MTKKCKVCEKNKEFSEFAIHRQCKYGLDNRCKACRKLIYEKNRSTILAQKSQYYYQNIDLIKIRNKTKYLKAKANNYYTRTDEVRRREKELSKTENYKKRKRDAARKLANEQPMFRLRKTLRCRLHGALLARRWNKNNSVLYVIGIDLKGLTSHIEKQFKDGMSWSNYGKGEGKWCIDHMVPLDLANTKEDMETLFHYTNLQPLWELENCSKGAKLLPEHANHLQRLLPIAKAQIVASVPAAQHL